MKTQILYEDKDLLVVQKPAGLAAQTVRVGQQDVVSELKNYLAAQEASDRRGNDRSGGKQKLPYIGIIHRLDQPVEGLLIFAKNRSSAAALTAQLNGSGESGTLHKHYYAVFCGKAPAKEGTLVDYMYKDDSRRAVVLKKEQSGGKSKAKRAVLHYLVLQERTVQGNLLSLADVEIETGRFHQIRAQMAHAGMSLLGDAKYADASAQALSKQMKIQNAALCAYSLEFVHPNTKQKMQFRITPQGNAFLFFDFPLFTTSV